MLTVSVCKRLTITGAVFLFYHTAGATADLMGAEKLLNLEPKRHRI